MFWKNEDRVIDNLLRSNMRGRSGANPACREFDPDLANAYIERGLTARERTGYERHLSECHACRSSVVALSRMVAVETAPVVAATRGREASRLATLKGMFTTSTMPRVAAAALALLVLAVSIPLLFSREDRESSNRSDSSQVAVEQRSNTVGGLPSSPQATEPAALKSDPTQPVAAATEKARTARDQEQTPPAQGEIAVSQQQPKEPEAIQGGAGPARVEPSESEKADAKNSETKSGEAESSNQARKAESDTPVVAKEQAAPPAPAPVVESQGTLGRISADDARRLRQQDKDAVSVTIKPGRRDGVPGVGKEERSTIRPGDAVAPPSSSSAASGERRGLAEPSPRANREESTAGGAGFAARGSATRKVGSKKFWLSKDTWTDKDYNPNKEMPVVTIERGSDIYKELLTKRGGLKLYLMGFGEGERAIFVYKGTVYRLVPQNSR